MAGDKSPTSCKSIRLQLLGATIGDSKDPDIEWLTSPVSLYQIDDLAREWSMRSQGQLQDSGQVLPLIMGDPQGPQLHARVEVTQHTGARWVVLKLSLKHGMSCEYSRVAQHWRLFRTS